MKERYKTMSIQIDADGMRSQMALMDTKTLLLLVIDDGNNQSDNLGYVSVLDGGVLADRGVVDSSQSGEIIVAQTLTKDDYLKSVVWDTPYAVDNEIERGSAWMRGVNEFLKTINNSNV